MQDSLDSEITINSGAGFEREPANLSVGVEIKDLVKVCSFCCHFKDWVSEIIFDGKEKISFSFPQSNNLLILISRNYKRFLKILGYGLELLFL